MSMKNKAKDRGPDGRIRRKYTGPYYRPYGTSSPKWFRKLFEIWPRRRLNRLGCRAILRGSDPDATLWPTGNNKPSTYYD